MKNLTTVSFILFISIVISSCNLAGSDSTQMSNKIKKADPVLSGFEGPHLGVINDIIITDEAYFFASGAGNPGVLFQERNTGLWHNHLSFPYDIIKLDILSNDVIIAGGEGGIYHSEDDGKTWNISLKGEEIPFNEIHDIEESPDGIVFAAVNTIATNNNFTGLVRSVNGQGNWTSIPTPFKINDILFKGDTLFAAGNGGVLISKNEGKSWQTFFEDIAVAIDKDEKGSIWVAGEYFIFNWDGSKWIRFEGTDFGFLQSLKVHSSQSVYYAYSQGKTVFELNPNTEQIREIPVNQSVITLETTSDDLYIGTDGDGVLKISHSDFTNALEKVGVPPFANELQIDYQGNFLVSLPNTGSTNNGLYWSEQQSSDWKRISNWGDVFVTPNDGYFQIINPEVRHSLTYGQSWTISEIDVLQGEQFSINSYWIGINNTIRVLGEAVFNSSSNLLLEFSKGDWEIIGEIPRIDAWAGSIVETENGIFLSTREGIVKITNDLDNFETVHAMNMKFAPRIFSDEQGRLYTNNEDGDVIRSNKDVTEWTQLLRAEENLFYFATMMDSKSRIWVQGREMDPRTGEVKNRFFLVSNDDGVEFLRLEADQWNSANYISLTETPEGELIVGTDNSGWQIIESIKD